MILPETDNAGASVVAQLMLERLAQEPIPHQGSPFAQVTVSIGIACTTATDLDYGESLLKRADQALYIAKETGRNRMQVDAG